MSYRYINAVKKHSKQTGTHRMVMFLIADHADDDGIAWPGDKCLAEEAATSERNIRRIIQDLIDADEIEIIDGGNGRGNFRHIRILLPLCEENRTPSAAFTHSDAPPAMDTEPQKRTESADFEGEKADTGDQKSGHPAREKRTDSAEKADIFGTHTIYEPIEPFIEPNDNHAREGEPDEKPSRRSRRTDPNFAKLCTLTESEGFGMMTPLLSDQLNDWMDDYPATWIETAFGIAVRKNKRSYAYVNGILKNFRAKGFDQEKATNDDQDTGGTSAGRNGAHSRPSASHWDTSNPRHPGWQKYARKASEGRALTPEEVEQLRANINF